MPRRRSGSASGGRALPARGPDREVTLLAADGTRISAAHDAAAHHPAAQDPAAQDPAAHEAAAHDTAAHDPAAPRDLAVVVAHGFTGSWRRPAVRAVVAALTSYAGVVSFDFRGHGRSSGRSTVGDLEVLDLDAALAWARLLGYRRVATVGFSMGASVVVRHAGLRSGTPGAPDAVVAVSSPSRWYYRGTRPMQRVHVAIEHPLGRRFAALALGTRIAADGWDPVPEPPVALAPRIAPVPLLVVHGDRDAFFPLDHGQALFDAACEPKELWVEPGMGHAEVGASADLLDRIGAWLRAQVAEPTPETTQPERTLVERTES